MIEDLTGVNGCPAAAVTDRARHARPRLGPGSMKRGQPRGGAKQECASMLSSFL